MNVTVYWAVTKSERNPLEDFAAQRGVGGVHPSGTHSKNRKTYRSSETIFSNHSIGVAVLKLSWVFVGSSRSVILWCEKNSMFSMERRERKDPRDYFKRNLKVLKLNWKYEYMFYLLKQYFWAVHSQSFKTTIHIRTRSTPIAQFLVSNYRLKETRAPWRRGWSQARCRRGR